MKKIWTTLKSNKERFERTHAWLSQIYNQERSSSRIKNKIPIQLFDDVLNKNIEYLLNDIVGITILINPIFACHKKMMKRYCLCKSFLTNAIQQQNMLAFLCVFLNYIAKELESINFALHLQLLSTFTLSITNKTLNLVKLLSWMQVNWILRRRPAK